MPNNCIWVPLTIITNTIDVDYKQTEDVNQII